MGKQAITVIHSDSKIETLFTLFPLLISGYSHLVRFIHINSAEVKTAGGACVILVRVFKGNKLLVSDTAKKRAFIENLRKRFTRVVVLDDGDGSDSLHYEYMDLTDLYYKGKLLKDRSLYLQPMYGRQFFTDYYSKAYGVSDEKEKLREVPQDPKLVEKLRVSWNLGYGLYPIQPTAVIKLVSGTAKLGMLKALKPWYAYQRQQMLASLNRPTDLGGRLKKVQARFGNSPVPNTVSFQRKMLLGKCQHCPYVLTGKVSPKQYKQEMKQVAAVLSPFGWGEICFRDFEAIFNGSLLIKPNMDNIETWPNIFQHSKTYIPIDWDGNDFLDTLERLFQDLSAYTDIIDTAKQTYRKALYDIEGRVKEFLEEASGMALPEPLPA